MGTLIPFVEVALGEGGGPRCSRCSRRPPATHRPSAEILADVSAACESWGGGPGPNVAFTGSEPFRHPELPALIKGAVSAGVERLRLDTDGIGLADPANAAGVVSAGVRHVRVTLLGGSSESHDSLTGAAGGFERTKAGVRAFLAAAEAADARVDVSVLVPVCSHDVHELPGAVAAAAAAGACRAILDVADETLDLKAAMPWIAAACDSGTANRCWVEVAGVPLCLAGSYTLHFLPLLGSAEAGEKAEHCAACALDRWCGGVRPGTAPQVKAALAPPQLEERLAGDIERAFLAPAGPGEGE